MINDSDCIRLNYCNSLWPRLKCIANEEAFSFAFNAGRVRCGSWHWPPRTARKPIIHLHGPLFTNLPPFSKLHWSIGGADYRDGRPVSNVRNTKCFELFSRSQRNLSGEKTKWKHESFEMKQRLDNENTVWKYPLTAERKRASGKRDTTKFSCDLTLRRIRCKWQIK